MLPVGSIKEMEFLLCILKFELKIFTFSCNCSGFLTYTSFNTINVRQNEGGRKWWTKPPLFCFFVCGPGAVSKVVKVYWMRANIWSYLVAADYASQQIWQPLIGALSGRHAWVARRRVEPNRFPLDPRLRFLVLSFTVTIIGYNFLSFTPHSLLLINIATPNVNTQLKRVSPDSLCFLSPACHVF